MGNVFNNGTVLPSGLLDKQGTQDAIVAFNRSYRDTRLKAGIVIKSYAPNDPFNQNGLCTEYDVQTIEQFENKGTVPITYRNCLSQQGFGSLADYVEYTLRPLTFQTNKGTPTFADQDGAVVLIECLDGIGEKAVVIGNLIHPDRKTNILSNLPRFSAEYNGVNLEVNNDGSCSLTFKGATDSKGNPIVPSQGNTVFQIKTDGSFEFNHSSISINADRGGTLTINTKADATLNIGGNANVRVAGNTEIITLGNTEIETLGNTDILTIGTTNIISSGLTTIDGSAIRLGVDAIESIIKGDTFAEIFDNHVHVGPFGVPTGVPLTSAIPSLSHHVFTE